MVTAAHDVVKEWPGLVGLIAATERRIFAARSPPRVGGFIEILFFLAWLYSAGIIIRHLGGRWRSIADLRGGGERQRSDSTTLLVLIDVKSLIAAGRRQKLSMSGILTVSVAWGGVICM